MRLNWYKMSPEGYKAMLGLQKIVDESKIDHRLLELIKIRASQINGCAHCLEMHTKDSLALGENEQRDRIPSIVETPHPYVCRTCGHLVVGPVEEHCPSCGAWPATFQWFAPNYWFEALDPFAAIEKLRQTPLEVAAALEALSEQAMDQDPREGNWAIRNVITHLRDAQEVLDYRLDLFAAEEHPVLASKAVWTWATREEERQPATREIFEDYLATRRKILARLEALPLADWWRTGLHEEFGEVSLRQQASYFASHELTHLPQLAALREQLAGAG